MLNRIRRSGMSTFTIIWFGQLVSLLGTAMTRFALLIWIYDQTGQATSLALLGFFSFGASVLVSPLAGVIIDRLDRRWVLIGADLGAGLMTVALLILYSIGHLQVWHLYLTSALTGAFEAFQIPAYAAATTLLVPKAHYARASGMRSLAESAADILAPFTAGLLLSVVALSGIMLLDVGTFLIAATTLLLVRIPRPAPEEAADQQGQKWHDLTLGFRYIFQRTGLLGLLLINMGINFFGSLTYLALLPAMVLARSGSDPIALASVQAALGIGALAGGFYMSIWGGPKRRIHGVLGGTAISFILGDLLFAVGQSVTVWMIAAFIAAFFLPILIGSYRAIWQAKVAPQVQGRVFAVLTMFNRSTMPMAYLLAGPLADHVFEPAMAPGGALVFLSWLVGAGPGAGMALMFGCTGVLGMLMSLSGYLFRAIRQVEGDLPDHDAMPQPSS
ncbi:MAG: MFS transporter [Candidatus Tectomicrobia bacterium]|nr:MFS transporter [Candidatus Tectomicrobia bacterium]